MGASCGFERSLLPRMAVSVFREQNSLTRLNFVATFGLFKALANAISGPLADKFGRKPILVAGCLVGLPVMPFVVVAPTWNSITYMNAAFGLSQGLIGSSLFFLFIDRLGPAKRGIAVGVGECTIYVSTALVNLLAGHLASLYGYRPVPFYVATAFSLIGLLSTWPLHDTLELTAALDDDDDETQAERKERRYLARLGSAQPSVVTPAEAAAAAVLLEEDDDDDEYDNNNNGDGDYDDDLSLIAPRCDDGDGGYDGEYGSFLRSTTHTVDSERATAKKRKQRRHRGGEGSSGGGPWDDIRRLGRNPSFVILCLGGLMINFKDGFAWGSFPVFFRLHSMSNEHTSLLVALYPLCWGFSQIYTGAMSDMFGRKIFLLSGSVFCAFAMCLYAVPGRAWGFEGDERHFVTWVAADAVLGIGTAMMYPSLQAGAADEADPSCRGLALGLYRFVRDMGYVVGAIACGHLTDRIGYEATFVVNGALLGLLFFGFVVFYHQSTATGRPPVYLVRMESTSSSW